MSKNGRGFGSSQSSEDFRVGAGWRLAARRCRGSLSQGGEYQFESFDIEDYRHARGDGGEAGAQSCPIIRIDTNQGVYGLGEVRDGASATYALFLEEPAGGRESAATRQDFSARSNSLAGTRGRVEGFAQWRWRCGTLRARSTTLRFT